MSHVYRAMYGLVVPEIGEASLAVTSLLHLTLIRPVQAGISRLTPLGRLLSLQ
jgi:hypothetical protein